MILSIPGKGQQIIHKSDKNVISEHRPHAPLERGWTASQSHGASHLWHRRHRLFGCRVYKMPQPRPPGNLKEQCVRNVIKNIDSYWCRDYVKNWLEMSKNLMYVMGPFEGLPSSIIELMVENLSKSGKLRKHHLHLLLLHHLERLVLIRGTSDFGYILSLLPIRCKKLCHLGLKGKNLPHKQLNEAFMSLNHLQTVDLSQTNVMDETLSVIASYCKYIRVLNLSDTDVTDRSIFSLCHGDRRVGISATDKPSTGISATEKCFSETEKLSLNVSEKPDISKSLIKLDLHGTVVTFLGIQCALMNLPNLQEITHSLLLYAVAKLQMRRERMANSVSEEGKTVSEIQPLKIRLLQSDDFGKVKVWP
ncbi:uncharacterized protein [Panulirus ornatus]|uniref:uncharacterized protein n=1 Tax=Panulirus ornatus TaxID=150431 RepID=UPI003A89FD57